MKKIRKVRRVPASEATAKKSSVAVVEKDVGMKEKKQIPTVGTKRKVTVIKTKKPAGETRSPKLEVKKTESKKQDPVDVKKEWLTGRAMGIAVLTVTAIVVLVVGVMIGPGKASVAKDTPDVIPAAPNGDVVVSAIGRSEPVGEERSLSFSVSGLIQKIMVKEGQKVTKDHILCELENAQEKAAVDLASAGLMEAEAALAKTKAGPQKEVKELAALEGKRALVYWEMLKVGPRKEERIALEKSYRVAVARESNARSTLKRLRPAYERNSISEEVIIRAKEGMRAAEAETAAAKAKLDWRSLPARKEEIKRAELAWKAAEAESRRLNNLPRPEDLKSAEARVVVAKAKLAEAEGALEKTRLRAPTTGTILLLKTKEGERVDVFNTSPVLVMGNVQKIILRVEVDEMDVGRLHIGQRIAATARGLESSGYTGKVVSMGSRMGRKRLFTDLPDERIDTHVLEVLVELDGSPGVPVGYRFKVSFLKEGR